MAIHNDMGRIGERIAHKYLLSKGYKVKDVNYREKWGEIDIVAIYKNTHVFVEVKTGEKGSVYDPMEHMHTEKLKRQKRVIETYQMKRGVELWRYDVIRVLLEPGGTRAFVKHFKGVVL